MRRTALLLAGGLTLSLLPTLLASPASAQQPKQPPNNQLGPLCTDAATPVEQQLAACNRIIEMKVLTGTQLAGIYGWRAVAWKRKGEYARVVADATEALRLQPNNIAVLNERGAAYYDLGEYDIAI